MNHRLAILIFATRALKIMKNVRKKANLAHASETGNYYIRGLVIYIFNIF